MKLQVKKPHCGNSIDFGYLLSRLKLFISLMDSKTDWIEVGNMQDIIPKRAFTFIEAEPNEEIYEISIKLRDVNGALSKAAKTLSDANVNIRTSSLFVTEGESGIGYWTSFVDLAKTKGSVKALEKSIRELDVVKDVNIVKPSPLVYDVIHFPILHGDSTAMIMPAELFGSLFQEMERILMPSGFAAVIYNAGKRSGASMANRYNEKYNLKDEKLARAFVQATKAIGWGQVENFAFEKGMSPVRVQIADCFEAHLRGQPTSDGVCHWTRGFIAGFLGIVAGERMEAAEVKCAARGDRRCEFEITPMSM